MITLKKAYLKARKIFDRDIECIGQDIKFYIELEDCYAFLSVDIDHNASGKMFVVNKVGGKTTSMDQMMFSLMNDEYDSENLIEIEENMFDENNVEEDVEQINVFDILETDDNLDFSERDLIFN